MYGANFIQALLQEIGMQIFTYVNMIPQRGTSSAYHICPSPRVVGKNAKGFTKAALVVEFVAMEK
jgi:hypothetical protein